MTHAPHNSANERVLIAAFEGWSDAGAATTTVLQHLGELLNAEVLHVIGADGFVDFQVHRPKVSFDENGRRQLEWPETRMYGTVHRPNSPIDASGPIGTANPIGTDGSGNTDAPRVETIRRIDGTPVTDIFLLAGVEPARDWGAFAEEVVELVDDWGIDSVILIGSLFSDSPHSRPIVTTISSDNANMRARTGA